MVSWKNLMNNIKAKPLEFEVDGRKYRQVYKAGRVFAVATGKEDDGMLGPEIKMRFDGRLLPAVVVRILKESDLCEMSLIYEGQQPDDPTYAADFHNRIEEEIRKMLSDKPELSAMNGVRIIDNPAHALRYPNRKDFVYNFIFNLCKYEVPDTIAVPLHMSILHQGIFLCHSKAL